MKKTTETPATENEQAAIVNLYVDDDRRTLVLHERKGNVMSTRRVRAEFVTFHELKKFTKGQLQELRHMQSVRGLREEGAWLRISWIDDNARRAGRRFMKENGIAVYEGDVDPELLWLAESGAPIGKPRRCYLDIESDSDIPLSRKEDMRTLTWTVVDHDTGKVTRAVLERDDDASEKRLLEQLVGVLRGYQQICIWEGDWSGGEFDSVVVPSRCSQRGIDFDFRHVLWTNQLAVWKRHSSAESGAEGSFKLDVIAHEQLGDGKEHVPQFVIDRFGEAACRHGLGRMSRQLYDAGGEFRQLLLDYNEKDTVLLRRLEMEKRYIELQGALATVCGLTHHDRAMGPTRLMDGYMLRLGRKVGRRFATRERFEAEDVPKKFRGAIVFPPKSVPNSSNNEDEAWTIEQAAAWRKENGFKNGILHGIHVCDFSGMYPNIMRTFNLGVEVKAGWAKRPEDLKPDQCMSPGTGLVTSTVEAALITFAFAELAKARKHWQDLAASLPPGTPDWINAMAMSNAFKVAMNSFYGAGGTPNSRFYDRDVSEATTQNAVHFLKLAASEAASRRMVLAYGDTDSTFLCGPTIEGFAKFVRWLNETRFPAEVTKHHAKENHIKIAFEKSYSRVVFVTKKRYVAKYLHYKFSTTCNLCTVGKNKNPGSVDIRTLKCRDCGHQYTEIPPFLGKPEIKGLAFKRGDTYALARELQGRVIDLLVGGVKVKDAKGIEVPANPGTKTPTEDIAIYRQLVEQYRDKAISGPLVIGDVLLSKGLSEGLRHYAKDTSAPIHVRVARLLQDRGLKISKGMKIEYVIADASVSPQIAIPADDFVGECDRYHLWENTWEPSKELLIAAFPDEDWGRWDVKRPPRERMTKKGGASPGQLGLSLGPVQTKETRLKAEDEIAVPAYRSAPLRIEVPEGAGVEMIDRVMWALAENPGARTVAVVIRLKSGGEALIPTTLRVSPGPKLRAAIDEARKPLEESRDSSPAS